MSDINSNKKFCKYVKLIFGTENKVTKTITLVEEEVITNDEKLAQTFNEYFVNIV